MCIFKYEKQPRNCTWIIVKIQQQLCLNPNPPLAHCVRVYSVLHVHHVLCALCTLNIPFIFPSLNALNVCLASGINQYHGETIQHNSNQVYCLTIRLSLSSVDIYRGHHRPDFRSRAQQCLLLMIFATKCFIIVVQNGGEGSLPPQIK